MHNRFPKCLMWQTRVYTRSTEKGEVLVNLQFTQWRNRHERSERADDANSCRLYTPTHKREGSVGTYMESNPTDSTPDMRSSAMASSMMLANRVNTSMRITRWAAVNELADAPRGVVALGRSLSPTMVGVPPYIKLSPVENEIAREKND